MTQLRTSEGSYAETLTRWGIHARRVGVWAQHGTPTLRHGWKLHLSSVQVEAEALLRLVVPVLQAYDVPFKCAAEPWILGLLNEGALGDTQVGKFLTVYVDVLPPDRQQELVSRLVDLTAGFHGPRVVTDAHLGGVVYCRYGEIFPEKHRNRLGLFESDGGDRELVRYRVPFEVPDGVAGAERFGITPVDEPKLKALGPGYLPVGTLASHAKGTVYLALDLRTQADVKKVVLKQGRAGCMSDEVGRDIRDRLRHHATVEAAVRGRVRTAAVESCFLSDGDAFLALELVDGSDLRRFAGVAFRRRNAASRSELLDALRATAQELAALHQCGFVHRDLSPANVFITPDGAAWLMDLELAYEIGGSDVPYSQGTAGFVSPQQERNEAPAPSDDVFSFGAVMGSLLTGFPGHLLPVGGAALGARLARLSGADTALCDVVAACLEAEPGNRPAMADVLLALSAAEPDGSSRSATLPPEPADLAAAVDGGVRWLLDGAPRDDRTGMWLSPVLEAAHAPHAAPVAEWRVYRSANRGVAGVVYLLARLWRHGVTRDDRVPAAVERAVDWLLAHHESPDDQMPGLHFGEAGVAVAVCEAIAAELIEPGAWTEPYLREVFASTPDWPDLTHGAAGQGLAALLCAELTGAAWLSAAADAYAEHLVAAQAADGSWVLPAGVEEMEDKAFTGCAHGTAGIVHFLACHASIRDDARSLEAAEHGAEWLLDEARPTSSGSGLSWPLDPTVTDSWNWWCHGAPGIALAFLSLYRATGDELYAGTARACLRTIPDDFRAANLSQCHGLAGLGELLLEGYDVLGDVELRERGVQLAGALADLAVPVGSGLAWRVESLYSREADLVTGGAGVVHVLARAASAERGFGMPLQLPAGGARSAGS